MGELDTKRKEIELFSRAYLNFGLAHSNFKALDKCTVVMFEIAVH